MRAFAAVPVAIVCVAAPAFANAQSHVTAARKAERRGEWRKALREWKAAYAAEMNAEYLIGIGDAYAHLGNTSQAKKNYEAYLNDPLALPANVQKVKAKLTQLEAPGKTFALRAVRISAAPASAARSGGGACEERAGQGRRVIHAAATAAPGRAGEAGSGQQGGGARGRRQGAGEGEAHRDSHSSAGKGRCSGRRGGGKPAAA